MSKKRSKSATGSAGMQRWEQALLSTPFAEEGKWTATVALLVGNQLEDYQHIDILTAAVNTGSRKLFSIITKDDLYAQVNDLGNPKNKKGKEAPANYEVCEPCKDYLDSGEDIPVALLAKLLKFKLLEIKQKDLKRRENEKKAASEKDKPGKKGGDKKERGKSPAKGGKGGKKTPEPPSAKEGSKLKRRGEEDTGNRYIDDEPEDGTDNYVFISGFHEAHLIGQLSELGVHVECVVKVTSEDYSRFDIKTSPFDELDQPQEPDEKQLAADEEAKKMREKKVKEMKLFWKDVLLLMQAAAPGSKLHDVARLEYVVKESIIPDTSDDPEKMTKFGIDLFEDTACMLYDLLDAKRQWKNFMENLKLIHIPDMAQATAVPNAQEIQSMPSVTPAPTVTKTEKGVATEPVANAETETKTSTEVDMRYYNELLGSVPQESISVPLVIHCMLEQIVASEEDKEPPRETPRPPRTDGVEESLASHINSVAFKLALSEEDQQALATDFEAPKQPEPVRKQPLLVSYRDNSTKRLGHLKTVDGFDPLKAELEMMGYYAVSDLQDLPSSTPREMKDRAARLQELLHFCATGGTTASEIDHVFKQFVLECTELTGTNSDGYVQAQPDTPQVDIPWDDPYPFFKGMIPRVIDEEDENVEIDELGLLDARSGAKSPSLVPQESTMPAETVLTSGDKGESNSRPGSGSILKERGSTNSRKSISAHSVHFEKDKEGNLLAQPGDEEEMFRQPTPPAEVDLPDLDLMNTVNEVQKRNLDQWCFAEHLEPSVLLQVLKESLYTHPVIDTYYHRRDHSLMVVLHNPHAENLLSHQDWHCALYSNVGFRNYLEYIAESVSDWTRGQEAKYQASLLAKEVEKIQKDAEEASSRPPSGKKRDRSKSPKKSPSRSGKSPSRSSSAERPSSANPYVRQGSLKAWKEEQDRIKAEEEEKERQKQEKRARSAQRKASKEQAAEEKKEKRPGSRSSSKSKVSKEEVAPPAEQPEEPKAEEQFWPFMGYDMENHLLHAKGRVSSMFPADGALIRSEKYEFIQGTIGVKTSVHKDGHTFMVHVLDPKDRDEEEAVEDRPASVPPTDEVQQPDNKSDRTEQLTTRSEATNVETTSEGSARGEEADQPADKKPCVGRFGSFCAQLNDGMSLALSAYGTTGEPENGRKYEPKPYVAPPPRSPSPTGKDAGSPTKGKRDKGKEKAAATPEPVAQEEEPKEEVKVKVVIPEQTFQQLYVTCPDGLHVNYSLESAAGVAPPDAQTKRLLVRQSYPNATRGLQPSEARRKAAMEESSRTVTSTGTVIKTLKSGATQVLYPDGGLSQFCISTPLIPASRNVSPQRAGSAKSDRATPTKKKERHSRSSAKKKEVQEAPVEEVVVELGYWITTTAFGERVATAMDGSKIPIRDSLVCKASDPHTKEVMYTRDDHTMIVHHPDGTTVVEHADGTRMTTFISELKLPSDLSEFDDETGETTTVQTKQIKLVQVECPGFATLRFDTESSECSTEFGTGTIINTFLDGSYDMYHNDGGYLRVDPDATCVYHTRPNSDLEVLDTNQQFQYVMKHFDDVIVETTDNQGNVFHVQKNGDTNVQMAGGNEVITEEAIGAEEDVADDTPASGIRTRRVTHYKQHAPKFFIINQDGSGTELLRYQDVSEFIANAEDDLSTAILMDPLPDFPGVLGITVMKPYSRDVSEMWLKEYSQTSIMPPGLKSRDLMTLPAQEVKTDGPVFGTNVGQGLAIGSLIRSPPQPPILKCPSALEIRQLLQYKPVSEDTRTQLSSSLREYAEYVKARLEDSEAMQVYDPRSEEERILAADLQSQVTADESVQQDVPQPAQGVQQPAQPVPLGDDVKNLYERVTAPPVPSPPPTPQAKRTQADWDRDARERQQEAECRKALREHSVPPYFESQLGKAFLLTQAPNVETMAKQLSEDPRRDDTRAERSDSNSPQSDQINRMSSSVPPTDTVLHESHISDRSLSSTSPPDQNGAVTITQASTPTIAGATGNTPSALRPGNPTPSHANGQGSPTALRPHNPTPAHATVFVPDRPDNPAPVADTPSVYPSIPEVPRPEISPEGDTTIGTTPDNLPNVRINVRGEPRLQPIQIPGYIRSGRPGARPNDRFSQIEDPVRRKTYTTSITGATTKGSQILAGMRGLELLPNHVDFGTLREGSMYSFNVYLKNTGVDSCRFKVKQPPPSTGMKVLFKPGPVAAGMKAELRVEIYAIAVGVEGERGIGKISHDLEITTETDHLSVPVTATVLTAYEYDNQDHATPKSGKAPGVLLISDKAPGSQGIIRPRKDTVPAVH